MIEVTLEDGTKRRLWCTFGPQQIDLNPFSKSGTSQCHNCSLRCSVLWQPVFKHDSNASCEWSYTIFTFLTILLRLHQTEYGSWCFQNGQKICKTDAVGVKVGAIICQMLYDAVLCKFTKFLIGERSQGDWGAWEISRGCGCGSSGRLSCQHTHIVSALRAGG